MCLLQYYRVWEDFRLVQDDCNPTTPVEEAFDEEMDVNEVCEIETEPQYS